jgi:hypothetical protein
MTRYGLVCLLLAGMAFGQAASSTSAAAAPKQAMPGGSQSAVPAGTPPATQSQPAADVPPDAPVITINGLCENPPADKSSADSCKTVITRAEFEKVVDAVQPAMPSRVRGQFAKNYARALVMAQKAEQMGLDKGPAFDERMQIMRINVLSQAFNKSIQDKASQVSDQDIQDYYQKNTSKFEEANLERVYIPKTQQAPPDSKTSAVDQQKRATESEPAMKAEADKLHTRAVAGEDFSKLEADAYQAAGRGDPA